MYSSLDTTFRTRKLARNSRETARKSAIVPAIDLCIGGEHFLYRWKIVDSSLPCFEGTLGPIATPSFVVSKKLLPHCDDIHFVRAPFVNNFDLEAVD